MKANHLSPAIVLCSIRQAPASGWGKPTDDATSISPVLREVVAETITNLVCKFELITISATNICISGKGGKSTCNVRSTS